MKLIGSIVALVVGLGLIGALGGAAVLAVRALVAVFAALDPAVANVTAIACAVALVSAGLIARGIDAASRRNRATVLREEKTATYQLLVDCWTNRLHQPRRRTASDDAELAGKLQVLDRLLALYGAAPVVRAHAALRQLAYDKGVEHPAVVAQLGGVLVAIRRDLGADTPRHIGDELTRLLLPPTDESVRLRAAMARP